MSKKQTAVHWLLERLHSEPFLTHEDFTQAIAMEREQIEHAWHDGHSPYGHLFVGNYYENTYGKEAGHEA